MPTIIAAPPGRQIKLAIGGMTCATCAGRVERKLNRMDGVHATVNYATGRAKVVFADAVAPESLVATVEATGYTAALPERQPRRDPAGGDPTAAETAAVRTRLLVALALTIPGMTVYPRRSRTVTPLLCGTSAPACTAVIFPPSMTTF